MHCLIVGLLPVMYLVKCEQRLLQIATSELLHRRAQLQLEVLNIHSRAHGVCVRGVCVRGVRVRACNYISAGCNSRGATGSKCRGESD